MESIPHSYRMLVWDLWYTVTTLVLGFCLWSQVVIDNEFQHHELSITYTKNKVFLYV